MATSSSPRTRRATSSSTLRAHGTPSARSTSRLRQRSSCARRSAIRLHGAFQIAQFRRRTVRAHSPTQPHQPQLRKGGRSAAQLGSGTHRSKRWAGRPSTRARSVRSSSRARCPPRPASPACARATRSRADVSIAALQQDGELAPALADRRIERARRVHVQGRAHLGLVRAARAAPRVGFAARAPAANRASLWLTRTLHTPIFPPLTPWGEQALRALRPIHGCLPRLPRHHAAAGGAGLRHGRLAQPPPGARN